MDDYVSQVLCMHSAYISGQKSSTSYMCTCVHVCFREDTVKCRLIVDTVMCVLLCHLAAQRYGDNITIHIPADGRSWTHGIRAR